MTSKLTQFINQILKEKKHAQKNAQMYKGLYHGLFPSTYIHVDYKDWMKVVNELRTLRKSNKHWENFQNAMVRGCDIDDIPWDGGDYDFVEIAKRLSEYEKHSKLLGMTHARNIEYAVKLKKIEENLRAKKIWNQVASEI